MIKFLLSIVIAFLVGCTSQPTKTYQPANMSAFVPNCRIANAQIDMLTRYIDEYNEYYRTHPVTREDQRYYGRLKNSIWSLRSSCSALQR